MSERRPQRPGKPIRAATVNRLVKIGEGHGPPLEWFPYRQVTVRLSGSASPYAATEVRGVASGQWENDPAGRTWARAYEANNIAGLGGRVVDADEDPAGDLRFHYVARGVVTQCGTQRALVSVFGCISGPGPVGILVEARLGNQVLASATTGPMGATSNLSATLSWSGSTSPRLITIRVYYPSGAVDQAATWSRCDESRWLTFVQPIPDSLTLSINMNVVDVGPPLVITPVTVTATLTTAAAEAIRSTILTYPWFDGTGPATRLWYSPISIPTAGLADGPQPYVVDPVFGFLITAPWFCNSSGGTWNGHAIYNGARLLIVGEHNVTGGQACVPAYGPSKDAGTTLQPHNPILPTYSPAFQHCLCTPGAWVVNSRVPVRIVTCSPFSAEIMASGGVWGNAQLGINPTFWSGSLVE